MVQIIQSGPTAATLRQQALNQAFGNIASGLSAYQKQEEQDAKTQRQQALQEMQLTQDLRKQGYDVSQDQVSQFLKPTEKQGFIDKLLGNEAPKQEKIDLYGKRTAEWTAAQERQKAKQIREDEISTLDLENKRTIS